MTTKTQEPERATISLTDLSKHNTKADCWIAVHSKVWDITDFINDHPGGPSVLLKCAGSNATKIFDEVHAPDILEELPDEKLVGVLQDATPDVPAASSQSGGTNSTTKSSAETVQTAFTSTQEQNAIPPLDSIIGVPDFEVVASKALTPKTWAFYSSAATDLITHKNNKELVRRIMIRPRILRNVSHIDMRTTILGFESSAPFFISPAAMAKLVHPDGELALSRGAANENIIQCISSNASYTLKSIVSAAPPTQPFFFQLYINSERHKTIAILRSARALGIKAVFVTVDAPVPGKREADERAAQAGTIRAAISGAESSKDKKGSGLGRLMAQYIDKSITWEDLSWIREASGVPIVLKGVQTADDVRLAVEYGVDGVLLSNHGGRSLDGSQASILVLLELREQCPEIFDKLEVYIDGGFERGSDILKAIALGATAVGVGRPFLYSLVYGQPGVEHLSQILKDELETSMRLCGITSLRQATPAMVNTLDVEYLVVSEDRARQKKPMGRPRSKL
ncbi:Putative FMN-dependent dehydrogenase, cytochrome b5-like heme/steroid binding protein [Colletotrichum destructivum]|uniref:L-lactate dehydrogenase (cytochrome) n=1 Tax=Colletotrichum destructivum TaxID=34406 RepID=A0AAX4IFJ4_9PEZI|nr:Putative FMN-dependent dehydrogenase, cytochrome b5-like heme/steroid binding protein [Colletotrichum destructivum]